MTTKKRAKKSVFAPVRHNFLFQVTAGDGSKRIIKSPAKVRLGRVHIDLTVTAEDVQAALKAGGAGNSSKCTVAHCCYRMRDAFPHKIEGHVDWQYSRCFVCIKTNKFGLPSECIVYEHDNGIARMNDTRMGMFKLLEKIEKHGPITIHLRPYRRRSEEGRKGADRKTTGARGIGQPRGANLRFDIARLGAGPE